MGVYRDWYERELFQQKLVQRCPAIINHPSAAQSAAQTFRLFQWIKNTVRSLATKPKRALKKILSIQSNRDIPAATPPEPQQPAPDPKEIEIQRVAAFQKLVSADTHHSFQATDFDVIHCIGSLNAGGAERQLCYLAQEQAKRGLKVGIMTMHPLDGKQGHYMHLLEDSNIQIWTVGEQFNDSIAQQFKDRPELQDALESLQPDIQIPVLDLLGELFSNRPRVLHTWLDHCNIWAGYAGAIAGVERVILSTRNVNPMNFPYLAIPWFRVAYRELYKCPRIGWINNSQAGASDYTEWLGFSQSPFHVIRNGVDLSVIQRPSKHAVSQARDEFGASDSDIVITGIFRLSEEKQPLTFIALIKRLIAQGLPVRGVVVGIGPLESNLLHAISEHPDCSDRIKYLGRRKDVATLISASDIVVLCSRLEGTPNVLLEAQQLGKPVVATQGGGSAEAFQHNHTGLCVQYDNLDAITDAAQQLINNQALRESFGKAGPAFIAEHFGLDRMVDEHMALYHQQQTEHDSVQNLECSAVLKTHSEAT